MAKTKSPDINRPWCASQTITESRTLKSERSVPTCVLTASWFSNEKSMLQQLVQHLLQIAHDFQTPWIEVGQWEISLWMTSFQSGKRPRLKGITSPRVWSSIS